jgi:putative FmdB family regulatory protein
VPTYEYECEKCGRIYDVQQRISAPPLEQCQHCDGRVHRLLSPAPFILKGGGWYVTDYPSESRKKAMDAERKTSEPSGGGKSDAAGKSDGTGKSDGAATKTESKTASGSTPSGSAGSGGGSGTTP